MQIVDLIGFFLFFYFYVFFSQNGYPEDSFPSCLRRFVNNKCDKSPQISRIKEDRVETIFFIPYLGLSSIIFSQKIKELLNKYYCIDIRIVFTSFKVKNYFSLKCRTPLPLLANVVYKFKCLRDANNIYIGKTIRHLATRVKEHALHLLLYPIICHHARHAGQNSYVIIFRLLTLVKMTMRSLLRKLSILNLSLSSQQLIDNCSLRALLLF